MTHANLDGIPKTIAVGASLELLVILSLSFVSFFAQNESCCIWKGEQTKQVMLLNFCSQPEPEQSRVGCVESPLLWPLTSSPAHGIAYSVYYQEREQGNELGLKMPDHISQTAASLCCLLKGF